MRISTSKKFLIRRNCKEKILIFFPVFSGYVAFLWNTHSPELFNLKHLDPQIHKVMFYYLLLLINRKAATNLARGMKLSLVPPIR